MNSTDTSAWVEIHIYETYSAEGVIDCVLAGRRGTYAVSSGCS